MHSGEEVAVRGFGMPSRSRQARGALVVRLELRSMAASVARAAGRAALGALLLHGLVANRAAAGRVLRDSPKSALHAALTLGTTVLPVALMLVAP